MHWIDPGARVVGHFQTALLLDHLGGLLRRGVGCHGARRRGAVGGLSAWPRLPRPRASRPGCAAMWIASLVASSSATIGSPAPSPARATISTMRQRLVADSGRDSTMRTVSPMRASLRSSCALNLVDQADDALVQRVPRQTLDRHDDRLVHLVGHDAADLFLAHGAHSRAHSLTSSAALGGHAFSGCLLGRRSLSWRGATRPRTRPRAGRRRRGDARQLVLVEAALGDHGQHPRDRATRTWVSWL